MKHLILTFFILNYFCLAVYSQKNPKAPLKEKKPYPAETILPVKTNMDLPSSNQDSLIKIRLVNLAINNPAIDISNANIEIAKADLAFAKNSWLGSVVAGANINEFVIQGSPASSFFPKYNVGLSLPFDIFTRSKRDKKVSRENIIINNEVKKDKEQMLKAQVLIAYENYKEKNEIVFLQRSFIEYDFSAYEAAQKSYTDGVMLLEDMNKTYQKYLTEKAKLVTNERDFNIAVIQLEQLVGVPLSEALKVQ